MSHGMTILDKRYSQKQTYSLPRQVVIPRAEEHDTEIIAPGKHYMLYVGDNYWTLNSNLYYNVTDIPGVDIRVLEEVG